MADYSKQYDDAVGMGFHDFDLMDKFNECKSGYYLPVICEGSGSIGVMNDQGVCKLAFVDEEAENNRLHYGTGGKGTPVIWKTLDEVLKKYKK